MTAGPIDLAMSLLASSLRGWRGTQILADGVRPNRLPVLYDDEFDADCRVLRELITELDLDVLIKPCPRGGQRFRDELPASLKLPLLVDGRQRLEGAREASRHLLTYYAAGNGTARLLAALPLRPTARLASLARAHVDRRARASKAPALPLELYSFESSPYSRFVRERLCVLELPWILRSLGKQQLADYGPPTLRPTLKPYQPLPGSRRERMQRETGKVQVPYLIDPNTKVSLFESKAILEYLQREYAE